jgi:hypothetical protein
LNGKISRAFAHAVYTMDLTAWAKAEATRRID